MPDLITMKCPNCNANLEVDADREFCFCQYCGTKVVVNNPNKKTININKNVNITNRKIDDADVIRAENERLKLENEIYKEKATKTFDKKAMKFCLIGGPIMVIVGFLIEFASFTPSNIKMIFSIIAMSGMGVTLYGASLLFKK